MTALTSRIGDQQKVMQYQFYARTFLAQQLELTVPWKIATMEEG